MSLKFKIDQEIYNKKTKLLQKVIGIGYFIQDRGWYTKEHVETYYTDKLEPKFKKNDIVQSKEDQKYGEHLHIKQIIVIDNISNGNYKVKSLVSDNSLDIPFE